MCPRHAAYDASHERCDVGYMGNEANIWIGFRHVSHLFEHGTLADKSKNHVGHTFMQEASGHDQVDMTLYGIESSHVSDQEAAVLDPHSPSPCSSRAIRIEFLEVYAIPDCGTPSDPSPIDETLTQLVRNRCNRGCPAGRPAGEEPRTKCGMRRPSMECRHQARPASALQHCRQGCIKQCGIVVSMDHLGSQFAENPPDPHCEAEIDTRSTGNKLRRDRCRIEVKFTGSEGYVIQKKTVIAALFEATTGEAERGPLFAANFQTRQQVDHPRQLHLLPDTRYMRVARYSALGCVLIRLYPSLAQDRRRYSAARAAASFGSAVPLPSSLQRVK